MVEAFLFYWLSRYVLRIGSKDGISYVLPLVVRHNVSGVVQFVEC